MMDKIIRVAITGPECTGKSTLAARLASHYKTKYIPEYAREYIENLGRNYTYDDVVHIAETQLLQATGEFNTANRIVFLDTWLIITKVWFEVVYGRYPQWIDQQLQGGIIDLYLLCDTGIPWTPDNVRENGGAMREKLYTIYKSEIEKLNCQYAVIRGTGEQRFVNALEAIDKFFPDICAKSLK